MRAIFVIVAIAALVSCGKDGAGEAKSTQVEKGPGVGAGAVAAGHEAVDRAAELAAAAAEKTAEMGGAAADRIAAGGTVAVEAGAHAVAAGREALDRAAGLTASAAEKVAGVAEQAASAAKHAAGAAEQAAGAAAQAAGAASRAADAAGASATTAPADFPLALPSGIEGRFNDRTSRGRRTRSAVFSYTGDADQLAARFEADMKAEGLAPEVKKAALDQNRIISVKAAKGELEGKALITVAASGTSQVTIIWRESAP